MNDIKAENFLLRYKYTMDILRSPRLEWTITDSSLDGEFVTFDGHPLTPADLDLFNRPIRLRTPNLILNLLPMETSNTIQRVEFPTGSIVTPLQILGAIHTYYHIPLSVEELKRLDMITDNEFTREILGYTIQDVTQGDTVSRSQLMGDLVVLKEVKEEPDGSLTVELEV